jgi:hypothetical protein
MLDSQGYEPKGHPEFLFGREQDLTLRLHIMLILETMVRKSSQSPSQHLFRLQGKLKPNEKEKIYKFVSFYHIFQYSSALVISQFR